MSELKNCPFCGGEAIVVHDEKRKGAAKAGCWNVCYARPHVDVFGVGIEDAEQEATMRWNTRRSDPNA